MNSQEKKDARNTLELMTGTTEIVRDLEEHLADDGKISMFEWAQTAMENAPTIMRMVEGISEVDDELKDLDEEELKQVAAAGLEMSRAIWDLVSKMKK